MSRRISLVAVVIFAVAVAVQAQSLSLGNGTSSPNSSDFAIATTRTDVDLVGPANATGNVTTATFGWSAFPCTNAVKIKFFRRSGGDLTLVAERGPFSSTGSSTTVALTPAVAVQQGDLLAIARVANCGNPVAFIGIVTSGSLVYSGDVSGTVTFASGTRRAEVLAVNASGTATEKTAAVIPVVGSTAGSFGSNFKTSLQLVNGFTFGSAITGRLVLRKQGVAGSTSDPSIAYSVAPGTVQTFNDIVGSFGFNGLGSIDVVVPSGVNTPVIVARVYNDAGTVGGTAGLNESGINPTGDGFGFGSVTPFMGATAVMVTPNEPTRTRFNIGVRSLFAGAQITATLKNPDGTTVTTVTKSYPPNYFEQVSASSFFGGVSINANQTVVISVGDGSAIVYGATTDNVTNDPSIQYAIVVFAIA